MKTRRRRFDRRRAGFTLLETGIAVTLMAMIFIGTMTMYLSMARTTMRSQSEVFASASAANALQYMIQQSREAYDFKLPLEFSITNGISAPAAGASLPLSTYPDQFQGTASYACESPNTAPASVTTDQYYQESYQVGSTTVTINTAVVLFMPNAMADSISVYKSDGSTTYTYTPSGGVDNYMYDRTQNLPGNGVLYYRSDGNGVPHPGDGQYLWEYSLWDSGATYNKKLVQLFDTPAAASAVPNAVQFDRPTALPFQLEMKIICGNYSPINGVQTNEATGGSDATALTGKCVLMRDHALQDVNKGNGNSSTPVDNKFNPSGT